MTNFRRRQRLTPVLYEYALSAIPDDVDLRAGIRQRIRQRERQQQASLRPPRAPTLLQTLIAKATVAMRSGEDRDEVRSRLVIPRQFVTDWQIALATREWSARRMVRLMG